jgi:LAO/AO transport system kinase
MDGGALAGRVVAGDRRALAQAITLVESTRPADRGPALDLVEAAAAAGRKGLRVGLTGTPGVGKSSFIETLGLMLTGRGSRVAVLAVDPSSPVSGGSILGDKTRMPGLARDPLAFIRPSPSGMVPGGVARRSREVVALCEAAGFDVVLIETVGVGQGEGLVAELSDILVLLMAPAGGDELQGVKRGIMERADLILVNKADGVLQPVAERTRADYAAALGLLRRRAEDAAGFPAVACVSAATGAGVGEAWAQVEALAMWRRDNGFLDSRRARQARLWFETGVREGLVAAALARPGLRAAIERLGAEVAAGQTSPDRASLQILQAMTGV